ncbi:MAG: hypothetical protein SLAVMIC_00151 [uncultured marine phage]|uniref:Uncharacterized protein n=1 Tax=uncultured marine phage TaxID=707152 RepID=A0A8D9CBL1_9VIRU|nr:MAG: hypothetical protein SLAVMIC_00151 [uncultured marine phage]
MNKILKFLYPSREMVNGYRVVRDKKKPSICYTAPFWWERIGGYRDKMFHDTSHPEFKEKFCELVKKMNKNKI